MKTGPACQFCELLETCSFYWNYRDHPDVVRRELTDRFCHSDLVSPACKRIAWFRETMDFPPAGMSPEGDMIAPDASAAVAPTIPDSAPSPKEAHSIEQTGPAAR